MVHARLGCPRWNRVDGEDSGTGSGCVGLSLGAHRRTDTKPTVPAAPLPLPADDFSVYGPVEQRAVGKIQHYVGRVMQRNWTSIPHVTHNDEEIGRAHV